MSGIKRSVMKTETVMPESVKDGVGRRDLKLSVTWTEDVERVEDAAEKFYDFVKSID